MNHIYSRLNPTEKEAASTEEDIRQGYIEVVNVRKSHECSLTDGPTTKKPLGNLVDIG